MPRELVVCDCGGVGLCVGTAAEREAGALSETMPGAEVIAW